MSQTEGKLESDIFRNKTGSDYELRRQIGAIVINDQRSLIAT